jgi:hypothetical protein
MQRFLKYIRSKSRQKGQGFFYSHENANFRQNFDSLRARAAFEVR